MAEAPDLEVHVQQLEGHDDPQPHIVLPGRYAYREKLADYEITVTFQTLEEMREYVNNREHGKSK